ncbi:MAG TPA: hypothetical protein VGG19_03885 [Tepidisphaeraceae bacterium]|jgi:hypothetical protein
MLRADRWIIIALVSLCAWCASARAGAPIVFAWNPLTSQPGLSPMAMMYCTDAPTVAMGKIAAVFPRLAQQQRSLMLSGCMGGQSPVFSAGTLKSIVENGPAYQAEQRYLQLIFTQMKLRGYVPARIVLDLEGGLTTWTLKPANGLLSTVMIPVYNDSASLRKLPASLQQYTPFDFDNGTNNRAATIAWNAWQGNLVSQTLRQTVSVTASQVFGANIPATNYGDMLPSFTVYDLNNWPVSGAAVGTESSPPMYLAVEGNRYSGMQKDVRWNRLIDALNYARSCIRNGPVVPWLGFPSYAGDSDLHGGVPWLWRQQVLHLNAMGITQYLYFNPAPSVLPSDDAYASQVFRSIQTVTPAPAVNLPAIPLDADSVTTGNITTKYTDFIANLPGGAGAILK